MMTGLRARGAMVSTYWSVFVTVRIAHTEMIEIGIKMDATTTSTQAEMRRGKCPRRVFWFFGWVAAGVSAPAAAAAGDVPAASTLSGLSCIWGSVSLIWASPVAMPSADMTGAHTCDGVALVAVSQNGGRSNGPRVVAISAISGFMAPLVFVSIIVLRKVTRRGPRPVRHWNRRLQHEIARWT